MGIGDKKKALMEADKGAPGGVAALDESGKVVGAIAKNGCGNPGNGCDLSTLAGKNGWYMLYDGNTYVNAPRDFSGWGVLWVLDKAATLYQLNTGIIYYSSNLAVNPTGWMKMYNEVNKPDALKKTVQMRVNLSSTSAADFDGSQNCYPGVTGVLPVLLGGTGCQSLTALRDALKAIWDD